MKKVLYFLTFSVLLTGCGENFLNVNPETYQGAANFFQTKSQFTQAVNGAYAPLQGIYNNQMWALAEMRSDNTSYQYNTGDRSGFPFEEIDEFREISNNTHTTGFFNNAVLGISRANVILDRIDASTLDAASKDQIAGEASFLRAFYYFQLVRVFGDVPLVLKEVKSTDEAFTVSVKKPVADIYAQILVDAKRAVDKLPDTYAAAADKGRAAKGSARTLLGEIYLTQKNYAAATTELKAVVSSAKYTLNANYADNFAVAKKNGPESVFEIQYVEGPNGENSSFIYTFAPYNSGASVAPFALASGAAAGWNAPTKDLLDAYEAGDLRKEASVGLNFIDPNTKAVAPYIKKYLNPHAVRFQTGDNFPVYRYSDVLLMLAESLNETGYQADAEAFALLNQVRSRAGLPAKTSGNALANLKVATQDDFRKAIAQERRVELSFENHRWFDLVRTGKVTETMTAHAAREKAAKSYVIAASYSDLKTLYAYPMREQDLIPK
jgi:hypothetical protein